MGTVTPELRNVSTLNDAGTHTSSIELHPATHAGGRPVTSSIVQPTVCLPATGKKASAWHRATWVTSGRMARFMMSSRRKSSVGSSSWL